jgi:hypothetical protein
MKDDISTQMGLQMIAAPRVFDVGEGEAPVLPACVCLTCTVLIQDKDKAEIEA